MQGVINHGTQLCVLPVYMLVIQQNEQTSDFTLISQDFQLTDFSIKLSFKEVNTAFSLILQFFLFHAL